ncbi:DUF262 domain-containing protein [Mesorhizobium sp. ISC11]|uniref:DUF262 domain-containing protein n=1 Tax=Mesorhizobium sp. ISC11 TaxID=3076428 RepID=UPI00301D3BB6
MPDFEEDVDEILTEQETVPTTASSLPKSDNEIEKAYADISFRVVYQSNNFFLPQISQLINGREVINLRPEYQRRLRWSRQKKSLLIESLLLNIPIPPIYLFESDLARYEVMDGQQRLNAIHEFIENDFSLNGLEKLGFLNGRRYKQLPPLVRRGLDRSSVSAIVLLQETRSDTDDPYLVRRYVFERLNTGGEKLNPQELRNSIYRSDFNNLIVKMARNDNFCTIFGIPKYTETDENEYYENPDRQNNSLYSKMADCQIVLRFFTLLDEKYIIGSMRSMLDNCMKRNMAASTQELQAHRSLFERTIEASAKIFGNEAFLLPPDEKGIRRISIALFDAFTVAIARREQRIQTFIDKKQQVHDAINQSLAQNLELLTGKANTAESVRERIKHVGGLLDAIPA